MSTVYSRLSFSSDDPDGHIPGLRMQKTPRVKLPPTMHLRNLFDLENYNYDANYVLPKVLSREDLIEKYAQEKREGHKAMQDQIVNSNYYVPHHEGTHAAKAKNVLSHNQDQNIESSMHLMMTDFDNGTVDLDTKNHDVKNDLANAKIKGLQYHKDLIEELNEELMLLEKDTSSNKQFLKQQLDDFAKIQQIQREEIIHIQHVVKQKTKKVPAIIRDETMEKIIAVYNIQEQIYLSFRERLNRVVRLYFHANKKRMKKFDMLRSYIAECEQHLKILKQKGNKNNSDSMMNPLLEEALPSNEELEFIQQFATKETSIKWPEEDQIKDVPDSEDNSAENDTGDETEKSGWLGCLHSNGKKSKKSKKKKKDKKEKVNKAKKDKKNDKGDGYVESEKSDDSAEEKGDDNETKSNKKSRKDKKGKSKKEKGSFFANLFFPCFGGNIPKQTKRDYISNDSADEPAGKDNDDKTEQTTSEEIGASAVCKPSILTTQATTSAVRTPAKQTAKLPPKLVTTPPKPPIVSARRQRPEHKTKMAVTLQTKTVQILESMKGRTGCCSLEDGELMNQWLSSPFKKASIQHQGIAYTAEQSKQMEKISATGYSSYSAAEQMSSC